MSTATAPTTDKIQPARMIPASNYTAVKIYLENFTPFEHSSCHAYVVPQGARLRPQEEEGAAARELRGWVNDQARDRNVYVFFSYRTPVAAVSAEGVEINEYPYSTTTAKHRNYFRRIHAS